LGPIPNPQSPILNKCKKQSPINLRYKIFLHNK
jgi:hypothetical protein